MSRYQLTSTEVALLTGSLMHHVPLREGLSWVIERKPFALLIADGASIERTVLVADSGRELVNRVWAFIDGAAFSQNSTYIER